MLTTTIDISKTPTQLSDLLSLAQEGTEVIIAQGSTPVARLTSIAPPSEPHKQRSAGLHPGAIWISDDFDEPLGDEFWLGKE